MMKANRTHVRAVCEKIVDTGTIHYFKFGAEGLFLPISYIL